MKIILAIFLVVIIMIAGMFLYNLFTQKSELTPANIFNNTDMPALIISAIGLIIAIIFSVQSNSLANQSNSISKASYELAKNQGEQREDIDELKNIVKGQEIQISQLTELVKSNNSLNEATLEQTKILIGNTNQFSQQNSLLKLSNEQIVKQLQANVRFHLSGLKLQKHYIENAKYTLNYALNKLNTLIYDKTADLSGPDVTEYQISKFESELSELSIMVINIINSQKENHFLAMEPQVYENWMEFIPRMEQYEKSFYERQSFQEKKNKVIELFAWCSTYIDAIGGDLKYYYGEFFDQLLHEIDDLRFDEKR